MITREQVADLREGDVVEIRYPEWPGTTIRGPLVKRADALCVGGVAVHWLPGDDKRYAWMGSDDATLTVVSRAPRPLYVNHPRTKPAVGDVVRADGVKSSETWFYFGPEGAWASGKTCAFVNRATMPAVLRLLVDGETGEVVP